MLYFQDIGLKSTEYKMNGYICNSERGITLGVS